MKPELVEMEEKLLVGQVLEMNFPGDRIAELWRGFMPRLVEIGNRKTDDLISMAGYPAGSNFRQPLPCRTFRRYALAEVSSAGTVPEGMLAVTIPAGLYAVFHYRGSNMEAGAFFGSLFGSWLPEAGLMVDERPHFEVLGEKYSRDSGASEEEIWIPVRPSGLK